MSNYPEINIELQEENIRLKSEINKLKQTIREMNLKTINKQYQSVRNTDPHQQDAFSTNYSIHQLSGNEQDSQIQDKQIYQSQQLHPILNIGKSFQSSSDASKITEFVSPSSKIEDTERTQETVDVNLLQNIDQVGLPQSSNEKEIETELHSQKHNSFVQRSNHGSKFDLNQQLQQEIDALNKLRNPEIAKEFTVEEEIGQSNKNPKLDQNQKMQFNSVTTPDFSQSEINNRQTQQTVLTQHNNMLELTSSINLNDSRNFGSSYVDSNLTTIVHIKKDKPLTKMPYCQQIKDSLNTQSSLQSKLGDKCNKISKKVIGQRNSKSPHFNCLTEVTAQRQFYLKHKKTLSKTSGASFNSSFNNTKTPETVKKTINPLQILSSQTSSRVTSRSKPKQQTNFNIYSDNYLSKVRSKSQCKSEFETLHQPNLLKKELASVRKDDTLNRKSKKNIVQANIKAIEDKERKLRDLSKSVSATRTQQKKLNTKRNNQSISSVLSIKHPMRNKNSIVVPNLMKPVLQQRHQSRQPMTRNPAKANVLHFQSTTSQQTYKARPAPKSKKPEAILKHERPHFKEITPQRQKSPLNFSAYKGSGQNANKNSNQTSFQGQRKFSIEKANLDKVTKFMPHKRTSLTGFEEILHKVNFSKHCQNCSSLLFKGLSCTYCNYHQND